MPRVGAEMRIRIVPYEQLVDQDKNARGVFAKKWEVCVECDSLEEAERLKETLAQPKREWVGLTEEEKHDCYLRIDIWSRCVEMVEAKLREKNEC